MVRRDESQFAKKFMVWFIGIVLITSTFGVVFFGFSDGATSQRYNGYKFTPTQDGWIVKIDDTSTIFSYVPADVTYISLDPKITNLLRGKAQIDVTSESNDTYRQGIALAAYQMSIQASPFSTFIRNGFTGNNSYGSTIISCAQASQFVPVLYFAKANKTMVYEDSTNPSCIRIDIANEYEAVRAKDRILYGMLNIIP